MLVVSGGLTEREREMSSAWRPYVDAVIVTSLPYASRPFIEASDGQTRPTYVAGVEVRLISSAGCSLLLVESGVGLVNASMAATLALSEVQTGCLVAAGTAGSLSPRLGIGSVIVGTSYVNGGANVTAFSWSSGQVPGGPRSFPCDPSLRRVASTLAATDETIVLGQMLSSDTFIDERNISNALAVFPSALSADMESAAVAQVCYMADTPFIAAKGISDHCGTNAREQFLVNADEAASLSAEFCLTAIRRFKWEGSEGRG